MRVLVVQADPAIAEHLASELCSLGCVVDRAHTGSEALTTISRGNRRHLEFDGILLDRNLPDIDGFSVLRALREFGSYPPVFLLGDQVGSRDRIAGIETGADDYLTKPYDMDEIIAKLRAIRRRSRNDKKDDESIKIGKLCIDSKNNRILYGDVWVNISDIEYKIISVFINNCDAPVFIKGMCDIVFGYNDNVKNKFITNSIFSLKQKLLMLGLRPIIEASDGANIFLSDNV